MPPWEHEAHWPQAHSPARPYLRMAEQVLNPVSTAGLGLGRRCPSSACPLPPPGHGAGPGTPLTCPGVRARTGLTAVTHTVPS